MNNPAPFPPPPTASAYIAHLWDYPHLTIAIFGMQVQTPESYAMYEAAGIPQQMEEALAQAEGLLCVRHFSEGNGGCNCSIGVRMKTWPGSPTKCHTWPGGNG